MSNIEKIREAVEKYTYSFAIRTDRADFITDKSADIDEAKLLEIRCFDESGEFHAARSTVDSEFSCREITDDEKYADGYFDEAQYLDIDDKRTAADNEGWTYATGGGKYHLPEGVNGNKLILVRYYYKFDEEGVARKYDWRLVKFTDEETVGKEDNNNGEIGNG